MKPVYLQGLSPAVEREDLSRAIQDLVIKATGNLSWLNQGDRVLLKPALNSGDPYPSTTHPIAVSAMASLLTDRGAEVVVGDQSGIEHLLHHPEGVVRGSSRENYLRSGMGEGACTRFTGFEEDGWENGFFHHESQTTSSWQHGFFVTRWVQWADHIISLPRVSTHSMAGATLGFKNMVGLLREDSRMEFHANGPMNGFILRSAKGSTLTSSDDRSGRFLEKIVEISDAIRDRLRLTLFVATEVQATFGPDRYGVPISPTGLGHAYVVRPDPGLLFCSTDPVASEAVALAVLKDCRRRVPALQRAIESLALFNNPCIRAVDITKVPEHPYIRHGRKALLGDLPEGIVAGGVPDAVRQRLEELVWGKNE